MYKFMSKIRLQCLVLGIAIILMTPFLAGFDITRQITIEYDGHKKELRTNESNPQLIIEATGVPFKNGDSWKLLGPNKSLQDGSVIQVIRAKEFTVVRDGKEELLRSSKETVGEALKSLGISFKKSRIYPKADKELQSGMRVYVLNKGEELHFDEAEVDIPVKYIEDYSRNFGENLVKDGGKPGKSKVISKKVANADGTHSFTELGREILQEPESKVVLKGMAMSVKTPDGYKRYKKKIIAEASAYVATGNPTAVGIYPYVGIVAVDPRVIPLYTKMYIPGYGIAMAGDTGSYIIGNRIDLFYDDYNAAIHFGRRNVEVYILED